MSGSVNFSDLESLTIEEKFVYVLQLYQNSEEELSNALERLEQSKSQHAAEMQEIESYIEQIKSLTDERENLTLQFEKENDLLKSQIGKEHQDIADMLLQQQLHDIVTLTVPEQVAFLLVERAKLLDELEGIKPEMADELQQTDATDVSDADTQTDTSYLLNYTPVSAGLLDNTCLERGDCCDYASITDEMNDLFESSDLPNSHDCESCTKLKKDRNDLSSRLIVNDEQLKSMERRIARYKVLLGENVVNQDDEIYQLKTDLQEKEEELKATTQQLRETQEKLRDYQLVQSKPTACGDGVSSELVSVVDYKRVLVENCSLKQEIEFLNQKAAEDLENTILNYEDKLKAYDKSFINKSETLGDINMNLEMTKTELLQKIEGLNQTLVIQCQENSELKRSLADRDKEISDYQSQLEQTFAAQEEDLSRYEDLQKSHHELETEYLHLKSDFNDASKLSADNSQLVSKIEQLTRDNKTLAESMTVLQSQHSELLDRMASLAADYETVMTQSDQLSTTHLQLQQDYQQKILECQKLISDYSALQQIHQVLSDDVELFMSENEQLMSSNKQLQSKLDISESQILSLNAEADNFSQELLASQANLRETQKEVASANAELERTLSLLESTTEENGELAEENKIQQQKIQSLELSIQELEQDVLRTESQRGTHEQTQTAVLEKELVNLRANNDQWEEKYTLLNEFKIDLEIDNKALKEDYNILIQKFERLELEHSKLKSEYESVHADQTELESRHGSLQKELKRLQEQHKDLQLELDEIMSENYTLSNERDSLSKKWENLSLQLNDVQEELETTQEKNKQLQSELQFMKAISSSKVVEEEAVDDDFSEKEIVSESAVPCSHQRDFLDGGMTEFNKHKLEWDSLLKEKESKNAELTDRLILLEKAASQLESDNRELAFKLRDSINQNEALELSHRHEIQRLKAANTRLQEQIERSKKYGETKEKEMEALQEKLRNQNVKLQGGTEARESEILSLKTDLSQTKIEYDKRIDILDQQIHQYVLEAKILKENLLAKSEELSVTQIELGKVQRLLDNEVINRKQLESRNMKLEADSNRANEKLKEANERRMMIELENQKLAAELKAPHNHKAESHTLLAVRDSESSKALELADSRISILEKQRDDLNISLQRVTMDLENASRLLSDSSELKVELQSERNEIIKLRSQVKELQLHRTYEEKTASDLKKAVSSSKERELLIQEQNNQLRHRLLDVETKLNQLQNENFSLQQQVDTMESKSKSILQKLASLQNEKETLELELLAANEKLQSYVKYYCDRKTKHRNKLRTVKQLHQTEVAKLQEKMEGLERDSTMMRQSLQTEETYRKETERKYSTLVAENRNLKSKQIDLEDDIRERNRAITLLQTKLIYTEKENIDLSDLCNKLKYSPRPGADILDTLLAQQSIRSIKTPRYNDSQALTLTLGRTTSMESLLSDSKQSLIEKF